MTKHICNDTDYSPIIFTDEVDCGRVLLNRYLPKRYYSMCGTGMGKDLTIRDGDGDRIFRISHIPSDNFVFTTMVVVKIICEFGFNKIYGSFTFDEWQKHSNSLFAKCKLFDIDETHKEYIRHLEHEGHYVTLHTCDPTKEFVIILRKSRMGKGIKWLITNSQNLQSDTDLMIRGCCKENANESDTPVLDMVHSILQNADKAKSKEVLEREKMNNKLENEVAHLFRGIPVTITVVGTDMHGLPAFRIGKGWYSNHFSEQYSNHDSLLELMVQYRIKIINKMVRNRIDDVVAILHYADKDLFDIYTNVARHPINYGTASDDIKKLAKTLKKPSMRGARATMCTIDEFCPINMSLDVLSYSDAVSDLFKLSSNYNQKIYNELYPYCIDIDVRDYGAQIQIKTSNYYITDDSPELRLNTIYHLIDVKHLDTELEKIKTYLMKEYNKIKEKNQMKPKIENEITKFENGAEREIKTGKGRFDLMSPIALERYAKHMENCISEKYTERNWENGLPISNYMDSALRHLNQYMKGDKTEDHLVAAFWHIAAAMHTEELHPELQNIPSRK